MVTGASTKPILPDDSGHRDAWKHAIVGSTLTAINHHSATLRGNSRVPQRIDDGVFLG